MSIEDDFNDVCAYLEGTSSKCMCCSKRIQTRSNAQFVINKEMCCIDCEKKILSGNVDYIKKRWELYRAKK